jgi:hypothetical protein
MADTERRTGPLRHQIIWEEGWIHLLRGRETCISVSSLTIQVAWRRDASDLGRPWPMRSQALWSEVRPEERAILFKSAQFSSFYFDLTSLNFIYTRMAAPRVPFRATSRDSRVSGVDVGMNGILHGLAPTQNVSSSRWITGSAVRFHSQARREESRQRRRHGHQVPGSGAGRLARSGRTRGWFSSPCE